MRCVVVLAMLVPLAAGCGARTGLRVGDAARPLVDASVARDLGPPARDLGAPSDLGPPPPRCRSDRECDDGLFCTEVDRCDPVAGCVHTPRACSDGRTCTSDACDEAADFCRFTAVDACPILMHSDSAVYELDVRAGPARLLGASDATLTDIAYHPDGTVYAAIWPSFGRLDAPSRRFSPLFPMPGQLTAVVVTDAGEVLAGTDQGYFRVDVAARRAELIAPLPPDFFATGDLELIGSRVVATADTNTLDQLNHLLELDVAGRRARDLGSTGFPCVWGLAVVSQRLYGVTCNSQLITIDPVSARGTLVRQIDVAGWGATAQR